MRGFYGGLFISMLFAGSLLAQQPSKPKLNVSCTAEAASLRSSDTLELKISIENVGASDVYLYQNIEWGWAGIRFRLTNANGDVIPVRQHLAPPLPPPPIRGKEQLVRLAPTYFYGTHEALSMGLFDLKPGIYFLRVSFASNYHAWQGFGLPILTHEDGEFLSNDVRIEIRPT